MSDESTPRRQPRLLLTGARGGIGRFLSGELPRHGYDVRGIDVSDADGNEADIVADVRDFAAVREAMRGIDVVVHAGAIPNDRGDGQLIMETNVQGTWNVLQAAAEEGVGRVVYFSSINAQGSVKGMRPTEYLPIDDDYPHHPMTPYQLSKHLTEEMCRSFSERYGMITLCLRPTWVTYPETYRDEAFGTPDFAETWRDTLWSYVDVRDVADAVLRSLRLDGTLHDAFLLAASDTSVAEPTRPILEREHADTPWRGVPPEQYFAHDPHRTLIDTSHAREVLGWTARHSWRDRDAAAAAEEGDAR
jgi:UDP-glucose 4-epimerase